MKQAWYRCVEWIDGRQRAVDINAFYSITLPAPRARTTRVPDAWVEHLTFPDFSEDQNPGWQQHEILAWFDQHGVEFFEPLEIWHVPELHQEFVRRTGRRPRPDRSYVKPWHRRTRETGRRLAGATWRRMFR
jgi:hypothetical protein